MPSSKTIRYTSSNVAIDDAVDNLLDRRLGLRKSADVRIQAITKVRFRNAVDFTIDTLALPDQSSSIRQVTAMSGPRLLARGHRAVEL